MIIADECILCKKKFNWHEIVLWKSPENIRFCMECVEKFDDDNKYNWKEAWIVQEYEEGIEFIFNNLKKNG